MGKRGWGEEKIKKTLLTLTLVVGLTATAQVKVGSNPTTIDTGTTNFQVEGTTTAEQFVVLKNGNVGIGTTTPARKLHVVGAQGAVAAFPTLYGADNFVIENNANTALALVSSETGSNNIRFYSSGSGATGPTTEIYSAAIAIGAYSAITRYSSTSGNYNQFRLLDNTGFQFVQSNVVKMLIDNNGNVGIGTTTPGGRLHVVYGTGTPHSFAWVADRDNCIIEAEAGKPSNIELLSDITTQIAFNTPTIRHNAGRIFYDNSSSAFAFSNNSALTTMVLRPDDIVFQTQGQNRMVIQPNGNVGIGTTTALSNLQLPTTETTNNAIRMGSEGRYGMGFANTSGLLDIFTHSLSTGIRIGFDNGSYGTTHANAFVYLSNNSNFGIGTMTPTSKLHVVGLPGYASDAAAGGGGLTAGAFYQTSGHATLPNGVIMVKQ